MATLGSLSPRSYRAEVAKLADSVEGFRGQAQRLIDSFKQFAGTGSIRDGFFLSDTVAEFAASSSKGVDYAPEVGQIGDTLHRLETERRHLLENIQVILVSPLEEFLRQDLLALEELKAGVAAAKEEYEQAQLRYDVARTSGKATARKGKELDEVRRQFEAANERYTGRLVDVLARKEFEVVEKLCSFMFAQANYFHDGYELLSALEPSMRLMMSSLVNAQNDYLEGKHQQALAEGGGGSGGAAAVLAHELQLKQGYVLVKRKQGGGWARKWMVVSDGLLYLYKGWKDLSPLQCVNLLLCTVKALPGGREHCFAVISPEVNMTVQATSAQDVAEWVATIEAGIGTQLTKKQQSSSRQEELTSGEAEFSYLKELREVSRANCVCADCDTESPEWGLMNLGVLICYECSGVHRSLGVHISKVRSLTLDSWNAELFHFMKVCGNGKGNEVYEYALAASGVAKPTSASDRAAREAYIRAKYEDKRFVKPVIGTKQEQQKRLLEACTAGDLFQVMEHIAQGVDVNFKVGDPDAKVSLLHQLAIDGKATTYVLELLIQNGAQVYAMTAKGLTPLHYAAMHDRVTYARMLMMRGASEDAEDKERRTPKKIAEDRLQASGESQVLQYFKGQIKDADLAGMQPVDMESLRTIKASFAEGISVIRAKLNLLRQELKAADTMEEAGDILRKLRIVKLAVCFEPAQAQSSMEGATAE